MTVKRIVSPPAEMHPTSRLASAAASLLSFLAVLMMISTTFASAQWSYTGCAALVPFGGGSSSATVGSSRVIEVTGSGGAFSLTAPCTIQGNLTLLFSIAPMRAQAVAGGRADVLVSVRGVSFIGIGIRMPSLVVQFAASSSNPFVPTALPVTFLVEQSTWDVGGFTTTVPANGPLSVVRLAVGSHAPQGTTVTLRSIRMAINSYRNDASGTLVFSLLRSLDALHLAGSTAALTISDTHVTMAGMLGAGHSTFATAFLEGLNLTAAARLAVFDSTMRYTNGSRLVTTDRIIYANLIMVNTLMVASGGSKILMANTSVTYADSRWEGAKGMQLYDKSSALLNDTHATLRNANALTGHRVMNIEAGNYFTIHDDSTFALIHSSIRFADLSVPGGGLLYGVWCRNIQFVRNAAFLISDFHVSLDGFDVSTSSGSLTFTAASFGALTMTDNASIVLEHIETISKNINDVSFIGRRQYVHALLLDGSVVAERNASITVRNATITLNQSTLVIAPYVVAVACASATELTFNDDSQLRVSDVTVQSAAVGLNTTWTSDVTFSVLSTVTSGVKAIRLARRSAVVVDGCRIWARNDTINGAVLAFAVAVLTPIIDADSTLTVQHTTILVETSTFGAIPSKNKEAGSMALIQIHNAAAISARSNIIITECSARLTNAAVRSEFFAGVMILRLLTDATLADASAVILTNNCGETKDTTFDATSVSYARAVQVGRVALGAIVAREEAVIRCGNCVLINRTLCVTGTARARRTKSLTLNRQSLSQQHNATMTVVIAAEPTTTAATATTTTAAASTPTTTMGTTASDPADSTTSAAATSTTTATPPPAANTTQRPTRTRTLTASITPRWPRRGGGITTTNSTANSEGLSAAAASGGANAMQGPWLALLIVAVFMILGGVVVIIVIVRRRRLLEASALATIHDASSPIGGGDGYNKTCLKESDSPPHQHQHHAVTTLTLEQLHRQGHTAQRSGGSGGGDANAKAMEMDEVLPSSEDLRSPHAAPPPCSASHYPDS